jgi:hypothetical protein
VALATHSQKAVDDSDQCVGVGYKTVAVYLVRAQAWTALGDLAQAASDYTVDTARVTRGHVA